MFLEMEIVEKEKSLLLKVKDSGVGLSPAKIEDILGGGTSSFLGISGERGYGLNLVYHLVKGLNGKLNVTSVQDQGAEFELILPMVR